MHCRLQTNALWGSSILCQHCILQSIAQKYPSVGDIYHKYVYLHYFIEGLCHHRLISYWARFNSPSQCGVQIMHCICKLSKGRAKNSYQASQSVG